MAEAKLEKKSSKVLAVDADLCIGCGACEGIAPDYFKIEDGVSTVIKPFDEKDADDIEDAINGCPVQAISLEEVKEKSAK